MSAKIIGDELEKRRVVNFDEIDRSFLAKMTTLLFYLIHSRVSLLTPVQKGYKDVVWLHSTGALGESASQGNLN